MAQTSPAMQVPMALIYAAFPASGVLMILELAVRLINSFKNPEELDGPREFID